MGLVFSQICLQERRGGRTEEQTSVYTRALTPAESHLIANKVGPDADRGEIERKEKIGEGEGEQLELMLQRTALSPRVEGEEDEEEIDEDRDGDGKPRRQSRHHRQFLAHVDQTGSVRRSGGRSGGSVVIDVAVGSGSVQFGRRTGVIESGR